MREAMMNFKKYFEHRLLVEMPAVPFGKEIYFDDADTAYLKPIADYVTQNYGDKYSGEEMRRLLGVVLAKAVAYRYSEKVLQKPDPSKRNISIQTQFEKTKGKKDFIPIRFDLEVDTHSKQLLQKLEDLGYDPAKINLTRDSSTRTAKEWLGNSYFHDSDKVPELSQAYALKDYKPNLTATSGGRKPFVTHVGGFGSSNAEDHRGGVKVKEPIYLDENDHEFIQAFKSQLSPDELKRVLVPAFMRRYSGHLVNDPKAMMPSKGHKAGEVMDWEVGGGRTIPIPVHIEALKQRLEDLKDKGVNFYDNPLPRVSAMRWMERGTYHPGFKAGSTVDTAKKVAGHKFDLIQKWIDGQNKHLSDPENVPSLNKASSRFKKNMDPSMDWMSILQHDANAGAKIALRFMQGQTNQPLGDSLDQLEQAAMDSLSSDAVVGSAEYADQDFRINKARQVATQEISTYLKHSKNNDTDMSAMAGRDHKRDDDNRDDAEKELRDFKIPTEAEAADVHVTPEMVKTYKSWLVTNLRADKEFGYSDTKLDAAAEMLGKMLIKLGEMNPDKIRSKGMPIALQHMAQSIIEKRKSNSGATEIKKDVPKKAIDVMTQTAAHTPPAPKKIKEPKAEPKPKEEPLRPASLKSTNLFGDDPEPAAEKPKKVKRAPMPTEKAPPLHIWAYDKKTNKWIPKKFGFGH
jgi:hypothetical protein